MNILICTNEKEIFAVDEGLSPSVAARLCRRYNDTWSKHKLYCKTSTLPLDCVVGYVYSDFNELTYEDFIKVLKKQFKEK